MARCADGNDCRTLLADRRREDRRPSLRVALIRKRREARLHNMRVRAEYLTRLHAGRDRVAGRAPRELADVESLHTEIDRRAERRPLRAPLARFRG